jgi:hypothetical protein
MQLQLADILAEIGQRCRAYAVGAFTQKDLVQIELEDFLLGQLVLDLQR